MSTENIINVAEVEEVDLEFHKYDYRSGNPAVFCCTYHKYAEGRPLAGMWLDLTSFFEYEEFEAACRWLHRDEEDPEFAFLDYENFPESWYDESSLDEDTFERILEYAELDAEEQEAFEDYLDDIDSSADVSDFREHYCGEASSEEDFAERLVDELDMLRDVPDSLKNYFDYEKFGRVLFMDDYHMSGRGYVFRIC